MSVMKWITVRVLIGFSVAIIGLLIGFGTNDMNISYNVFSMCGLALAGLGTFALGYGSRHGKAFECDNLLQMEQRFNEDMAWSINMLVIGGVNFLVPTLAYVIINA